MNHIMLLMGIIIAIIGALSIDILVIGIMLIVISLLMPSSNSKKTTIKSDKPSIIERLDKVKFEPFHEDALSNAISDTVAVTAKMINGTSADMSTKTMVKGTLNTVEGLSKVIK